MACGGWRGVGGGGDRAGLGGAPGRTDVGLGEDSLDRDHRGLVGIEPVRRGRGDPQQTLREIHVRGRSHHIDIERDHWLSAEEAVEYGLVSRVIERKTELRGA